VTTDDDAVLGPLAVLSYVALEAVHPVARRKNGAVRATFVAVTSGISRG